MRPDKVRPFALAAEAELLDLHQGDDGIVVIGLDEIDIRGRDRRLRVEVVTIAAPTAADLDRIGGEGVGAPRRPRQSPLAPTELRPDPPPHHPPAFLPRPPHDPTK